MEIQGIKIKLSKAIFVANHVKTNLNMEYTLSIPSLDFPSKFVQVVKKNLCFEVSQSSAIRENMVYFCFLSSVSSCFKCSLYCLVWTHTSKYIHYQDIFQMQHFFLRYLFLKYLNNLSLSYPPTHTPVFKTNNQLLSLQFLMLEISDPWL